MLGRLVLLLLQIAGGHFLTPIIAGHVPVPGEFSLFVYAIIAAIVVFLIGLLAAQVVKDVAQPSPATLSSALIFALVGAAVATWGPSLVPQIPWNKAPDRWIVLAGAILGYLAKR